MFTSQSDDEDSFDESDNNGSVTNSTTTTENPKEVIPKFLSITNLEPTNITSLSLNDTEFSDFKFLQNYNNLVSLAIAAATFMDHTLQHPKVRRLSLCSIDTSDYDLTGLTALSHLFLRECILTQKFFETLPKSLLDIQLSECSDASTPIYNIPPWVETIEIETDKRFPVFLTTGDRLKNVAIQIPSSVVGLSDTFIPELFFQCLPKSVKTLCISNAKELDNIFWKTFNLSSMDGLLDLTIIMEQASNFDFGILPHNLKKLTMDCQVTGSVFNPATFISNQLEELDLSFPIITDEHIRMLDTVCASSQLHSLTLQAKQKMFDFKQLHFGTIRKFLLKSDYFEPELGPKNWVLSLKLEDFPDTLYRFDIEYIGPLTGKMKVRLEVPRLTEAMLESGLLEGAGSITQLEMH
ncbi:unnamed protein product [Ambrosiozyma monospora]|uniref:Unnamed protein product n=1 Tax=Ambrosiozyma monospora TaxID=43982 RepID=A0ACB5TB03_AMBMO|nr:unnamed protein product [Ambrosiozyma monospora]